MRKENGMLFAFLNRTVRRHLNKTVKDLREWTGTSEGKKLQTEGTYCTNAPKQKYVWLGQGTRKKSVQRPEIIIIGIK